jgi:hypothetical protein
VWSTSITAAIVLLTALVAPSPAAAGAAPTAGADPVGVAAMVVAELHLLDLECMDKNDDWGSDEPYITVNGQRVWQRGNFDNRDLELIDLRFPFDEVVTVEVWEDDGGWTGSDDRMASWQFTAAEAGTGVHKVRTPWTFGHYDLRYVVY